MRETCLCYDNLIRIRGEIPTEYLAKIHQALLKNLETEVFDATPTGLRGVSSRKRVG